MNSLSPLLRALCPQIRLTSVQTTPLTDEGSIHLPARLAWALELEEFERIEVSNLTRCLRWAAHVRFGRDGEVRTTQFAGPLMQPGDRLKLAALTWAPANSPRSALLVLVDEHNFPVEIRHVPARTALLDPVSFPPPPAVEFISTPSRPSLVEATD